MTIVNTLITAAMNALKGVVPVVSRVRLRALSASTQSAVVVRPVSSDLFDQPDLSGYPYAWNTLFAVECYARASSAQAPDVAVDELLADVYSRLMTDMTLGGCAIALVPQGLTYDFDADGEQTVCATLTFIARQRQVGPTL